MFAYNTIKAWFKKILAFIHYARALKLLTKNASLGFPNSQLELAELLLEHEDFIEAYAWAEVACCRKQKNAERLKKQAEDKLKPEEMKTALDLATQYKRRFIPKNDRFF